MKPVDDVHPVATDLVHRSRVRLGHVQDDHGHPVTVVWRTTCAPGNTLGSASALARGNRLACVHVDDPWVGAVPLASGLCGTAQGSPERSGVAPTALCTRPAHHRAFREARATGAFCAWTPPQACLSHLVGEALGPLHLRAAGLARCPGAGVAMCALVSPNMPPPDDGRLQEGHGAEAPRSALLHAGAPC